MLLSISNISNSYKSHYYHLKFNFLNFKKITKIIYWKNLCLSISSTHFSNKQAQNSFLIPPQRKLFCAYRIRSTTYLFIIYISSVLTIMHLSQCTKVSNKVHQNIFNYPHKWHNPFMILSIMCYVQLVFKLCLIHPYNKR